ncbi:MAG: hypothetical protein PHD67_05020 [Oscillospiraceae bacterium]|nr:hypothetical protein [Oscillospiraceae bacterium]
MTTITERPVSDGGAAVLYTLTNRHGMEVTVSTRGAAVVSVLVPDREGCMADVAAGCPGAVSGPGGEGFSQKIWKAKVVESDHGKAVAMLYVSPDGEDGRPGVLRATAVFTLTALGELILSYWAAGDRDMTCDLSNRLCLNLGGREGGRALQELQLFGRPVPNAGPDASALLDFSGPRPLDSGLAAHYRALGNEPSQEPQACALLHHPENGRYVFCRTTAPGVQVSWDLEENGLCVKPCQPPQSPLPLLRAGEPFDSVTICQFGVRGRG